MWLQEGPVTGNCLSHLEVIFAQPPQHFNHMHSVIIRTSIFYQFSTLIKGIVCTKNIKHKRMTSQYKNARILLLGGALEYQRAPNQLASFNTLLQQVLFHCLTFFVMFYL